MQTLFKNIYKIIKLINKLMFLYKLKLHMIIKLKEALMSIQLLIYITIS